MTRSRHLPGNRDDSEAENRTARSTGSNEAQWRLCVGARGTITPPHSKFRLSTPSVVGEKNFATTTNYHLHDSSSVIIMPPP